MQSVIKLGCAAAASLLPGIAVAQQLSVDIAKISDTGVGEKIGTATITAGTKGGTTFHIRLTGVPAGAHGFHVHQTGNCDPAMKDGKMTAGVAAGEHFDPDAKKSHKGPQRGGHKGDLPALTATAKGIDQRVRAPRLDLADVQGLALIVHEGGDNYRDMPENGGGKGRIACGVVPKV